jgi:phage/plasmid-associated DNA primase
VLKSEEVLKGFLYWAVQGAIQWYASGLATPDFVATTTKKQKDGRNIRGILGLSISSLVAGSESSTPTGQNFNYALTSGDLLGTAATFATRYQTDTANQADFSPLLVKMRALYEQVKHHRTKTGSLHDRSDHGRSNNWRRAG